MNGIVKYFSEPLLRSNNWLDSFFDYPTQLSRNESTFDVNIFEKDDTLFVEAALPGITREEVNLDIENNSLSIGVQRKQENEKKGVNYIWKESSYSEASRIVSLPRDVDTENPVAELKDGLLTVSFKKAQKNKILIK